MIACVFISMAFATLVEAKPHTFLGNPVEVESLKEGTDRACATEKRGDQYTGNNCDLSCCLLKRPSCIWDVVGNKCQRSDHCNIEAGTTINWGNMNECKCGSTTCYKEVGDDKKIRKVSDKKCIAHLNECQ